MVKHITFDLETLGNNYNSPIIQIGAVKFEQSGSITDMFGYNIKWESLKRYNFDIDYSTIRWWLSQSREAQDSVIDQGGVDLITALTEFEKWIDKPEEYEYWAHATFDPIILANAYRKTGIKNPIPFRQQRDIRTLNFLVGKVEVEREGIAHTALDDAKFQAKYISAMLNKIQ